MDFSSASPRQPAQPHSMSQDGSPRSVRVLLPHISKVAHYINNVRLTCEDFLLMQDCLQTLLEHLQGRG